MDDDYDDYDDPEWELQAADDRSYEQRAADSLARLKRVKEIYRCSDEAACRFIDLRDEGHPTYQAAVMAGIADPTS